MKFGRSPEPPTPQFTLPLVTAIDPLLAFGLRVQVFIVGRILHRRSLLSPLVGSDKGFGHSYETRDDMDDKQKQKSDGHTLLPARHAITISAEPLTL